MCLQSRRSWPHGNAKSNPERRVLPWSLCQWGSEIPLTDRNMEWGRMCGAHKMSSPLLRQTQPFCTELIKKTEYMQGFTWALFCLFAVTHLILFLSWLSSSSSQSKDEIATLRNIGVLPHKWFASAVKWKIKLVHFFESTIDSEGRWHRCF